MATTRTTGRPSARSVGRAWSLFARGSPVRREFLLVRHRRSTLFLCALALAIAAPITGAQTVRIVPSIAVESTLTDNVNLSANRTPDWVNQFTPSVTFSEVSAHTHLSGGVSLPIVLYVR